MLPFQEDLREGAVDVLGDIGACTQKTHGERSDKAKEPGNIRKSGREVMEGHVAEVNAERLQE